MLNGSFTLTITGVLFRRNKNKAPEQKLPSECVKGELEGASQQLHQFPSTEHYHLLTSNLNGIYLSGSAASGASFPNLSDLDIQAIIQHPSPNPATTNSRLNSATPACRARRRN